MSSAAFGFVHAIRKHSKKCLAQKVVRLDRLHHHSVALVLLYSMRLEQSFSIERLQSYTSSECDVSMWYLREVCKNES